MCVAGNVYFSTCSLIPFAGSGGGDDLRGLTRRRSLALDAEARGWHRGRRLPAVHTGHPSLLAPQGISTRGKTHSSLSEEVLKVGPA